MSSADPNDDDAPKYDIEIAGSTDGGDRVPELSPREALERWLNKLRVSLRESTVSAYHYRLKHWVEFCEEEGIETTSELTGWDIESYEAHRREKGIEPISLSNELKTLRNHFDYLARIELVDEDLPEKVDPPTLEKSEQVNDERLQTERAQKLLEFYSSTEGERATRPHMLVAMAWFTGARLGALRALDLEDYDRDEQCLEFIHRPREETPLKNGSDGERIVGIPEPVCDLLDEYIGEHRHEVFDDYGRRPLLTSQVGRPSPNAVYAWMNLATVPCLYTECPHGNERETCEYVDYSKAFGCPSARSPHAVRTGSITWQLNQEIPPERVAERVNTSVEVLLKHYDQPSRMEEMRERRRPYLDRLTFDGNNGGER